jgi:tetratricopeptide (TPR) repeat protein
MHALSSRFLFIVFLLAASVGLLLAFVFGDALARYAWDEKRNGTLALALVRSDADLAIRIGNFYYGGSMTLQPQGEGIVYDVDRAAAAYRKALSIDTEVAWGHFQLARTYFSQGQLDAALIEINRELAVRPANLRALYVRGLIYGYQGSFALAADDFFRFTQWAPTEWAGYNDLSWVLLAEGRYDEAQEALIRARENVPGAAENPWLLNSAGIVALNSGRNQEAGETFTEALRLAKQLTVDDWRKAYPGDDPVHDAQALSAFRETISENLALAKQSP